MDPSVLQFLIVSPSGLGILALCLALLFSRSRILCAAAATFSVSLHVVTWLLLRSEMLTPPLADFPAEVFQYGLGTTSLLVLARFCWAGIREGRRHGGAQVQYEY